MKKSLLSSAVIACLFSTTLTPALLTGDFLDPSQDTPDPTSILRKKKIQKDSFATKTEQSHTLLYDLPSITQAPPNPPKDTSKPNDVAISEQHHQQPTYYNSHQQDNLIAQDTRPPTDAAGSKSILINFNNVNIIEYIRFVSRISNKNFVFDENDLQFNVTIISEEPATIENIMTALLQELRIHDLILIEEGNNLIIHKNPRVAAISQVVSDEYEAAHNKSDIVTQVFRLNTLDPDRAAMILRPLVSDNALVEVLKDTNHLIVTDFTANVTKMAQLLKSLDAPNSGLVIGQYVSRITPIGTLIPLAQQIMQPISQDQTLSFVLHPVTNSVFIVSSPFLVERTIAILQYLDEDQGSTRILNLNELRLGGATVPPTYHLPIQPTPYPFTTPQGYPQGYQQTAPTAPATSTTPGTQGIPSTQGTGTTFGAPGMLGTQGAIGTQGLQIQGPAGPLETTPGVPSETQVTPGISRIPGSSEIPGLTILPGSPGSPIQTNELGQPIPQRENVTFPSAGGAGFQGTLGIPPGASVGTGTTSTFPSESLTRSPSSFYNIQPGGLPAGQQRLPPESIYRTPSGQWMPSAQGNWIFKPEITPGEAFMQKQREQKGEPSGPPQGSWTRDYEGNWNFNPGQAGIGGPRGRWILDKDGNWVYELEHNEQPFNPAALNRQFQGRALLPGGLEKKAKFYVYKLEYRKGEKVEPALRQIADTIQQNERGNEDLVSTLRSTQWLEVTNSLVFSGTQDSLDKTIELITELDQPMRQVFIEMLIMETTLEDSLEFGVSYGTRFGGGDISGSQGFASGVSPLVSALSTAGLSGLGETIGKTVALTPDGTNLANSSGFNLGVIGRKITHCGTEFGSIGALVHSLHDRTKDEVISNPKILIEDGSPSEIFVGLNTPYRTQSISNDRGSVLTSNFEYRDIGTRLKVTPYLGNGDIIELDIEEEVSTIVAGLITNANTADTSPGPTTRINRTTTRVHIPDTYFLIISGMMQDEEARERNQVPCLGGVPLIGAAFSAKFNKSSKRNLMIFIRPKIIDTEAEIDWITKHQQDIYDYKNCFKSLDEEEVVEALDLFNIRKTLHPEDGKGEFDYDCGACQ